MIFIKKMPLSLAAQGAKKMKKKSNLYISLGASCQICKPIILLVLLNFRVGGLLILAELFDGVGHGRN
jgi:hypothetical protein